MRRNLLLIVVFAAGCADDGDTSTPEHGSYPPPGGSGPLIEPAFEGGPIAHELFAPEPFIVALHRDGPRGLHAIDGWVYWAEVPADGGQGRLVSVIPGTGNTIDQSAGEGAPWALAVDADTFYFTDPFELTVRTARKGEAGSSKFGDAYGAPLYLVQDERELYWANADGAIVVGDKDTGTSSILTNGPANPLAMALDDTYVYWASDEVGGVMRVLRAGGMAAESVSEANVTGGRLLVDATHVYWADSDKGSILRANKNGGAPEVVVGGYFGIGALTADRDTLFFTVAGGAEPGEVMSVLKTGGNAKMLAGNQIQPREIMVDETFVYWIDGAGSILRVER